MRIVIEVRNSRIGNADSARLDQLVHGRYPTDHRVYGGLLRSFGGLMLVVFPRSLFASPRVWLSVVQHTSSSSGKRKMLITVGVTSRYTVVIRTYYVEM